MVLGILVDVDVEGQFGILLMLLQEKSRSEIWDYLDCRIASFRELGLPRTAPDSAVWRACQQQHLVLITGNRNAKSADSLEETLRVFNSPTSLPVVTIANARRVQNDRTYAGRAADRLLQILFDLEGLYGTGRLYIP